MEWIDDADSYICPECGLIVNNPNKYEDCKCPNCGFQADSDKNRGVDMEEIIMNDNVNHPSHYTGKIEVIDFIEDKGLDFCTGNAIKYIARAGKKHSTGKSIKEKEIEDLEKAIWYLNRKISKLKTEENSGGNVDA